MKLRERIDRFRHTRGYGVHSPLAYRLVKHVVRPPRDVVYYGEEQLQALPGVFGRRLRNARVLLRLVAEFQPSFVWVAPKTDELLMEAVRLAGCAVRVFDGAHFPQEAFNSDFIVTEGRGITGKLASQLLSAGKPMVAFGVPGTVMAAPHTTLTGGVILEGTDSFIAVPRSDPALHSYIVSF